MFKRITLLASMALAVVAGMAPASQASITLSDEGGALAANALVTATSSNFVITRHNKTKVVCQKVPLHFQLEDAGTAHLELLQLREGTTQNCVLNREEAGMSNLPITNHDDTFGVGEGNILTLNTWGTGNTKASFRSTIYADAGHTILAADCTFSGTLHLQATPMPTDELNVPAATLNGPCGEGTTHGEFTLETTNGEQVFINYKAT